jgi:hypothetical protein
MSKKHGARSDVGRDNVISDLFGVPFASYLGGPKGFPKASTIASITSRRTAGTRNSRGLMNPAFTASIGLAFEPPEPGSFYEKYVEHDSITKAASEERADERRKRRNKERKFRRDLWFKGKQVAKSCGATPDDLFWPVCIAAGVQIIMAQMWRDLHEHLPRYHEPDRSRPLEHNPNPENGVQGVRRPSPPESRLPVRSYTAGPAGQINYVWQAWSCSDIPTDIRRHKLYGVKS